MCRPRMWLGLFWAANLAFLAYLMWNRPCPALVPAEPYMLRPTDPKDKVGRSLQEIGRESLWDARNLALGDTGFTASVGPVTYKDPPGQRPSYYSLSVYAPKGKTFVEGYRVMFQRDLWIGEVPENLIHAAAEEIVAFDPATRTVTFTVEPQHFQYTLPSREVALKE